MDISGKVMYHSTLSSGLNEISTNNFPSGVFVVQITNSNNNIS
jgi:hypothetical protein